MKHGRAIVVSGRLMDPCLICGWQYDPRRERDGAYDKVAPIFYHPYGGHVCRWCMGRQAVHSAFMDAERRIEQIERSWWTDSQESIGDRT